MRPWPSPHSTETAHVLFMDIVGYSRLSQEGQERVVNELTACVRSTQEFQRASALNELLICTTGDGMALIYFRFPDAPLRCAIELACSLKDRADLPLRIGIHLGPVNHITDINGNPNVAGDGINIAQRVMDCGDAGHILLSATIAEGLMRFEEWREALQDLGEREVKHGVKVHLFNFYRDDVGNPVPPALKTKQTSLPPPHFKEDTPSPFRVPFPSNPHFVGRGADMATLQKLLYPLPGNRKSHRAAIIGKGGEGKTQLAIQYAHEHSGTYPGGVFWVDARDEVALLRDFSEIGNRFFQLPAEPDLRRCAERLLDRLKKQPDPVLLILDNVTDATDLSQFPAGNNLYILITTQIDVFPTDVARLSLLRLDRKAALELLQTYRVAENEIEAQSAQAILTQVGCLPLALALAASHIKALGWNFTDYLERLIKDPSETLKSARGYFHSITGHTGSIFDTINLNYTGLKNREAVLILTTAACFFPYDISADLLCRASGFASREKFAEALARLRVRSLVEDETEEQKALRKAGHVTEQRLNLHEMIRIFTRLRVPARQRLSALERTITTFSAFLSEANDAMEWRAIRREIPHCQEAIELCRQETTPPPGFEDLLRELGRYFYENRDKPAARRYFEEALLVAERQHGMKSVAYIRILHQLAVTCQEAGDPTSAKLYARRALHLAIKLRPANLLLQADCCNDVGIVLRWQALRDTGTGSERYHHLDYALRLYRYAHTAYKTHYELNHPSVAMCLSNMGVALEAQQKFDEALKHFRQAHRIACRLHADENHVTVAMYLNHIGRVLSYQEEWEQALAHHEKARAVYTQVYEEKHPDVAASLYYIAEAHRGLRHFEVAHNCYQQAYTLFENTYGSDCRICHRIQERLDTLLD